MMSLTTIIQKISNLNKAIKPVQRRNKILLSGRIFSYALSEQVFYMPTRLGGIIR